MSARFTLSREDLMDVFSAFLWSLFSAVVAGLIGVFNGDLNGLPAWILPSVPIINTFLYAVWQFIKGPKA